jgi:SAM-dependent methyltransferase
LVVPQDAAPSHPLDLEPGRPNVLNQLLAAIHGPIYRRRIEVLSDLIVSQLQPGDKVLDIGCGSGILGAALAAHPKCPANVSVRGLEKAKRGNEPIEVIAHERGPLPFADGELDVVILADVLHHEEHEADLLAEAARITRRLLIVKDHKPEGLLAYQRICFLDWAANNPHGVKCLYRYHRYNEWQEMFRQQRLRPRTEQNTIDLYPPLFNLVFGKRLQYFVVLDKSGNQ